MPENPEPVFSGAPTIPSPEVFEQARRRNPVAYQRMERAYEEFAARPENAGVYPDPKGRGATVQQAWLVWAWIAGIKSYCLLVRPLPPASTHRITRLVNCTAVRLIEVLKSIQVAEGKVGVQLLYHDGRIGHSITVTAYDGARDRFVYHDPWPERSLLVKENNAAGVDAEHEEAKLWSVTARELERVTFAAFVFPHQWARVQGEAFDILYEQWKESEFFRFFHLKQLGERTEGGLVRRVFAPGAFKDYVALSVDCRETGKISRAFLSVSSDWGINNFLLAIDIAKSFVTCFAPPPDHATYTEVASALWNLRHPGFLLKTKDANPNESLGMSCVHAFMGSVEAADVITDFASFSIGNTAEGERRLEFVLY